MGHVAWRYSRSGTWTRRCLGWLLVNTLATANRILCYFFLTGLSGCESLQIFMNTSILLRSLDFLLSKSADLLIEIGLVIDWTTHDSCLMENGFYIFNHYHFLSLSLCPTHPFVSVMSLWLSVWFRAIVSICSCFFMNFFSYSLCLSFLLCLYLSLTLFF